MSHSTHALAKASPGTAAQPQFKVSVFKRGEGSGSFRESLKSAAAQASGQTQKANQVSNTTKTDDLKKAKVEELYKQFFAVSMFRMIPLSTPDQYSEED